MVDHTTNLATTISLFGAGEPSLWGEMVWGTDFWLEGSRGIEWELAKGIANALLSASAMDGFQVAKGVTDSITSDSASGFAVTKDVADGLASVSTTGKNFEKGIDDDISSDSTNGFDISHGYENLQVLESGTGKDSTHETTDSMGFSQSFDIYVQDQQGYYLDFPPEDAEQRNLTSFSSYSGSATSWTSASSGSTVWS